MKLTSEQLFNATIKLLSGKLANMRTYDTVKDDVINDCIEIAKRTAALIPETKKTLHNTGNLFKNFPWKDGGVRRCDMEKWLKEHSGYTSNRAMQTIINNALADGIIHKDMKVGRYFPGRDNSHA
jgi:hypothetical protein